MNTKKDIFLGQGCQALTDNPCLGEDWKEKFNFHQTPDINLDRFATDFAEQHVDIETVYGHSLGAITAIKVAMSSESIRKVVLLAPAPMPTMHFPLYLQKHMLLFAAKDPIEFSKMMLGMQFTPPIEIRRFALLSGLGPDEIKTSIENGGKWYGSHIRGSILSALGGLIGLCRFKHEKLRCKEIIVITGDSDNMIRPGFSLKVAKMLGAKHYVLSDSGHMVMLGEKADRNLKEIETLAGQVD